MAMNLGENYKLEADSQNLILYKKVTQEQLMEELLVAMANGDEADTDSVTGEDVKWKRCGFFSTLDGVCSYIVKKQIIEGINTQPLEQLIAGQRELALLISALDLKSFNLTSLRGKKPEPATSSQVIKEDTQEQQEESLSPLVLSE